MRSLYRVVAIGLALLLSVLPAHAALSPESIPAAFDELLKNQNLANPAMIIIDGNTGAVIYEKNAYSQRKPASVMKILTGAVVLEHLDPLSTFGTTVNINPEQKTVIVRGSYDPWISLDHSTARKMNRASLPYIGFRTMTYVKEFNGGSLKNYKVIYSGLYSQDGRDAGIILVGLHNVVKPDEELNHIKVGIKFIFVLVILVLGYTNLKKPELPKKVWLTMLGLTITNIVIASWR